jgi:hypothetical protein
MMHRILIITALCCGTALQAQEQVPSPATVNAPPQPQEQIPLSAAQEQPQSQEQVPLQAQEVNPLLPPLPQSLPAVQSAQASATPTGNVTINLINALVKKNILTAEEAQAMVIQAEQEASTVQAQINEVKAPPITEGDVRVTYVPDTVKNQIRESVTQDIKAQIKEGDIELVGDAPEWTERIKWFGDVRLRWRADLFPEGNANTGSFPNFNAINTGAPFDIAGTVFSPQYNVDQDRMRWQLRARLGLEASLGYGWYAGIALASGDSSTPVSQNQALGLANQGQGGNFSKYGLWLDRAFIRYELGSDLADNINFYFGRYNNPFFVTELMWDEDVNFDGVAIRGRKVFCDYFKVFGTAGAFPIFNTDFNFSTNQPAKFESTDKYLYAGQVGAEFKLLKKVSIKLAAGYFDFQDIEGRLSAPFIPLTPQDQGETDNTRPSFAQKGNTYRPLRNIIPSVINNFGTTNQYQYFGLASQFQDAVLSGRIDMDFWEPYRLSFSGEFIQNQAWDPETINEVAVNNRASNLVDGSLGEYAGGDIAWLVRADFGKPKFEKRGDWNIFVEPFWWWWNQCGRLRRRSTFGDFTECQPWCPLDECTADCRPYLQARCLLC